ncbi:MAG: hypothetical protein RL088_3057 [Verrucomicrobiota bacterium]
MKLHLALLLAVPLFCFGDESRARWQNTRLVGAPEGPPPYRAVRSWPQLATRPLVYAAAEPGTGRMLFIEQQAADWGASMMLKAFRDPVRVETLLEFPGYAYCIAFHPRFAENGFVFFGVNEPAEGGRKHSRVLRYTMRDGRPDPDSRRVVISWDSNGHNGAALAFAADGLLFVSSGDGTSDGDVDLAGQNIGSLRSKILRINVDTTDDKTPYTVPSDNPFVNVSGFAPETWAYGLRNPWRLTYDALSDQLWAGENGQDHWEYARLVRRGANYGWSHFEGAHVFNAEHKLGPDRVTFPEIEHSHAEFRSLTGGFVYRGAKLPELAGAYVYGDFGTGRIWAAKHDGKSMLWNRELADTSFAITSIVADADGEILITDYGAPIGAPGGGGGAFYRLEPLRAEPAPPFPVRLSETGLFSDTAAQTPAPGVLPYEIAHPAWHDGAGSRRWMAIPGGGKLEVTGAKSWLLPDGSAFVQTLTIEGRRVETRLLVKQQADWAAYSYLWNVEQTDAELAPKAGADIAVQRVDFRQPWRVPARAECLMCHSRQAGFAIALSEPQLDIGGQIERWREAGILKGEPRPAAERHPFRNDTPEDRARTYLAANCSHCHTLYGGGNSALEFDWTTPREKMNAIDAKPQHAQFGLVDPRIVAPGDMARSILPLRTSHRGAGHMPPVGTKIPDPDGTRILAEWVLSLK